MTDHYVDYSGPNEAKAECSHRNKISSDHDLEKRREEREVKRKSKSIFSRFFRPIARRGRSEDMNDKFDNYLDDNQHVLEAYIMKRVSVNRLQTWLDKKMDMKTDYVDKETLIAQTGTFKDFLLDYENTFQKRNINKLSIIIKLTKFIISKLSIDAYRIYKVDPNDSNSIKMFETDSANTVLSESELTNTTDDIVKLVTDVVDKQKCVRMSKGNNLEFPNSPDYAKDASNLLILPILITGVGKTMYVIEMWRIKDKFDNQDEEICANIVTAFYYCQLYLYKQGEFNLSNVLLGVVEFIFKEMVSLDQLIESILKSAQELVNADRASLFLVDTNNSELVSTLFDLKFNHGQDRNPKEPIRMPINRGIAGYVASSGKTLNIPDAYSDYRFNSEVDKATGYKTKNILCMPIKVRGKVIGVVEMVNKLNNYKFDTEDEVAFEKFSIFFGLALHNARLYDKMKRNEQRFKVALELLSYHNTCKELEVQELENDDRPMPRNFDDFYLDPYELDYLLKCKAAIKMFDSLFDLSKFDSMAVIKFILTVKKNYRSVPYHNFNHSWSVTHSMYLILKNDNEERFHYKMRLALFIACLCHDLDHRGYNNNYLNWTDSPLAAMYSSSPLENHHFSITVTILQQEGHNIFSHLPSEDYKEILVYIKQCILATDLAVFSPNLAKLKQIFGENSGHQFFNWEIPNNRNLAMALSMTAADLSASAKPWDIQIKTVQDVFEEFYDQGDKERQAGRTLLPMMDRNKPEEKSTSQVWFLENICIPCFDMLHKIFPKTEPMYKMAVKNLNTWKSM